MTSKVNLTTSPNPVSMEVFDPPAGVASAGKSIVVAYGTEGLNGPFGTLIRSFCADVAKAGITAVLPYYFDIVGTKPGTKSVGDALTSANMRAWATALGAAVRWCQAKQGNDRIGLVGFSRVAHIAAQTSLAVPVKCFVDFFGPMARFGMLPFPAGEEMTPALASKLPPTLIHHGKKDFFVSPSESANLSTWLTAAGVPCELHDKYDCGHPGQPELAWTDAAQKDATRATLTFLKKL
ncbi:MAG: dienelactone hydrolase family protein, partial [Planctomycetaceae bacterium]